MPYLLPLPSLDAFWHDNLYQLRTRPSAPADAEDITQWQAQNGFQLPESLSALYRRRNGGVSDWLNAVVGVEGPISLHANFGNHWSPLFGKGPLQGATLGEVSDGIDFGEDDASYRHALGDDVDRLWVIASYGSSQYLLLDYRSGDEPAVTLFDDDSRFAGDGSVRGTGLYVLARTFEGFLQNCRREIAHPLRVWSVDGSTVEDLAGRLAAGLSAVEQPPARMVIEHSWQPQYGQDHLGLPDPYLAAEFQADFGTVRQCGGGVLGEAIPRVYRNRSAQGTRAERFAGDDAVLVSLMLPVATPGELPSAAIEVIEEVIDAAGTPWRRWLDTGTAEFVAEDDMRSPYIDHAGSGGSSLSSAFAQRA